MDWVSSTVLAFGQSVGIADLALDGDGCALFMLEPGGTLCLQDLHPAADEILVVVSRPLPSPPAACARRALLMADFRTQRGWEIQLGLRGMDLVATLRMPRHSFMPSALEDAVEALFNFHTRVATVH